jgi:hypothetical protein
MHTPATIGSHRSGEIGSESPRSLGFGSSVLWSLVTLATSRYPVASNSLRRNDMLRGLPARLTRSNESRLTGRGRVSVAPAMPQNWTTPHRLEMRAGSTARLAATSGEARDRKPDYSPTSTNIPKEARVRWRLRAQAV